MKKVLSLLLALVMCLSLCACGGDASGGGIGGGTTTYKIYDTASTDAVEVKLKSVSYEDEYYIKGKSDAVPANGYTFVVIEFSVKNIGKTDLDYFPLPSGNYTYIPGAIVCVDYNDGYTFWLDDVKGKNGVTYDENDLYTNYPTLNELKPLGETATYKVAICVPYEVVDNTEAPLLIKFYLVKANGRSEVITYTIR